MDHILNSRGGQFGYESFERNRQIQIKNLTLAINEVLKEITIQLEDDQNDNMQEESSNQIADITNTKSKEIEQISENIIQAKNIILNSGTLEFPSTSNGIISDGKEQASSETFGETLTEETQDCKDLETSDDEYFTQPQAPNTFKGVFLDTVVDIDNTTKDKCGLAYKIIKFFIPPKMPAELLSFLSHPRLSGCAQTEKTLYYAQVDLYLGTHPLIEALFGISKSNFDKLGKVQSLMTEGLQSILSSFLNISQARRENVRPLIMNEAADVLKNVSPTVESLFGCDDIYLKKLKKTRSRKKVKTLKRKY